MALLYHLICSFLVFGLSAAESETGLSVHHNPHYPFVLDAHNHKFEGRICSDMELYALIPIEPDNLEEELEGGACVTYLEKYLKLVVRAVSWHNRTAETTSATTTTTLRPPHHGTTLHPYISDPIDLPSGVDFDIMNTDLIDVDDAYFLIVSNPDELRNVVDVQFYVVLVNLSDYEILSNPLPFAVRIDHPPDEGRPHGAAMFAGVLVLAIILIALLIPITVCVKRRRRAGKPVCKCTWGDKDVEKDEVKGRVNNGFIESREARTDSNVSSQDPQQTIGSHQLGSVSSMHFQPSWLHPHYKEMDKGIRVVEHTPIEMDSTPRRTANTPEEMTGGTKQAANRPREMDKKSKQTGSKPREMARGPPMITVTSAQQLRTAQDSRL